MKAVLISIQPKWCEKIFRGEKTLEVRKTAPKLERPFIAYVYQTKHRGGKAIINEALNSVFGGGKVIGSFICSGMMRPFDNLRLMAKQSLLTESELYEYSNGKELFGWRITKPKLFDKPKDLREFRKPCIDKYMYCQACKYGLVTLSPDEEEYAMYHGGYFDTFDTVCTNSVNRPPQSWYYVEEIYDDYT